jgi:hypothetical protein
MSTAASRGEIRKQPLREEKSAVVVATVQTELLARIIHSKKEKLVHYVSKER